MSNCQPRLRSPKPIVLLSLGHACVDVYQGSVAALVPYFVAERAYTYAAASGIVLAASLLSSVVQPLFGALTDRWAMPWLLPVSTLLAGVGIALSGSVASYPSMLAVVALSGIGVAAYHPESARVARMVSAGSHTAMSWFSVGGNIGFAAAPLMVSVVIASGGSGAFLWLVLPALAGVGLCLVVGRTLRAPGTSDTSATTDPRRPSSGTDDWTSFLRLSGAIVCRSIVFIGLSTFIALYARQRTGGGAFAGTAALFVLYLGGIVGTIAGGRLAHRYGRIPVVRAAYAVTVVAVAGVVFVPGPLLYLLVALASVGLYVPFSLNVTLGQDYLPRRVGTASGITLGLTVSVGGLVSPLIGAFADTTSLRAALTPLIALPAVGLCLMWTLHDPEMPESTCRATRSAPSEPKPTRVFSTLSRTDS